jgi:hypothetical protein
MILYIAKQDQGADAQPDKGKIPFQFTNESD